MRKRITKSDMTEYLVSKKDGERIRAFFYGEVFNRPEGDQVRILVHSNRAKLIREKLNINLKAEK